MCVLCDNKYEFYNAEGEVMIMKKIGALAVALLLLMQTAVFAADGGYSQKVADELAGLGIMVGDENGELHFEDPVTRAEFAALIVRTMSLEDAAESLTVGTVFSDVPAGHWAAGCIGLLSELGLVNGTGGGMYDPDGNVTLSQAAKVMVAVLGYDIMAQSSGGYPAGYLSVAQGKGLLKSISLQADSAMTRGDVAQLIYNSLDVPMLEQSYGAGGDYTVSEDTTLRSLRESGLEVTGSKGIVTANSITDLEGGSPVKAGQVRIGGELFDAGNTNAADCLGYEVTYFYRYTPGDALPVLTLASPTANNQTLRIDGGDINKVDKAALEILYQAPETQDEETAMLDSRFQTVFNGKILFGATDDDLTAAYGYLELLDNNNDQAYDYVMVHKRESGIVSRVDTEGQRIIFQDALSAGLREIELRDKKEYSYRITKEGKDISLSDIQPGDVATVEVSKDKTAYQIVVSPTPSFSAMVEELDTQEGTAVLDGELYELADNPLLTGLEALRAGREYQFYVDADGAIVYYDEDNVKDNYGYIIDVKQVGGSLSPVSVKLVMDNQVQVLELSETAQLDGERMGSQEIMAALTAQPAEKRVYLVTKSSDGTIKRLETPESYGTYGGKRFNKEYGAFSSVDPFRIGEGTTVFMIPENPTQDEDYLTDSDIEDNLLIDCQAFDIDPDTQVVKAVALFGNFSYEEGGTIVKDAPVSMVDKVTQSVDADTGEETYTIFVYQYDQYLELPVKPGSAVEGIAQGLRTGDLIKYSFNSLDRVDNIEVVATGILDMEPFYSGITDQEEEMFGYVSRAKEYWLKPNSNIPSNILYLSTDQTYTNERSFVMETQVESGKASPIYCIDKTRMTIYPVEFTDIRSYEDAGSGAQLAYVYSKNSAAQAAVIIKE